MIQQHSLLIRPPHLVCLSPASLPHSLPERPSKEISPGLLFTESRVGCSVSRTDPGSTPDIWGHFTFLPLLGGASPHPWAWELPVHNPSVLICPTQTCYPALSWAIRTGRRRDQWALGQLLTPSSCPGMMDTWTWAEQHSSPVSPVSVSLCLLSDLVTTRGLKLLPKFCETLILGQNQDNFALLSYRL